MKQNPVEWMGCICQADQPIFSHWLKEEAQWGSLIEGGDPVWWCSHMFESKLEISGKLGQTKTNNDVWLESDFNINYYWFIARIYGIV